MGFETDFAQWKTEYFGIYCMTKCGKMCCDSRNVSLYVNYEELTRLFGENIDPENYKKLGIKTHNAKWVYSIENNCLCGKYDERTHKCLIYDSRPLSCREYPFHVEVDAVAIKSGCFFAGGGTEYEKLADMAALYGKEIVIRR